MLTFNVIRRKIIFSNKTLIEKNDYVHFDDLGKHESL